MEKPEKKLDAGTGTSEKDTDKPEKQGSKAPAKQDSDSKALAQHDADIADNKDTVAVAPAPVLQHTAQSQSAPTEQTPPPRPTTREEKLLESLHGMEGGKAVGCVTHCRYGETVRHTW